MDGEARRIGLALGGGGGRGSAHIGVLMALEALEVPVDVLAGTSIGGLVAALYGVGYTPLQIEQWFLRATRRNILAADRTSGGFVGTHKIVALLREAFGDRTFADSRVPLALVAVDLVSASEVVLTEGPLVDAILASSAIPAVFPPVVKGDQVLVDGGVLNSVPVDVAYDLGAGKVIAVDLGGMTADFAFRPAADRPGTSWSPRRWLLRNQLTVADRSLAIMMDWMTRQRLRQTPPSIILRPTVARLMLFDFARTVDGRMAGERAAFNERAALERVRDWRLEAARPSSLARVPVPQAH